MFNAEDSYARTRRKSREKAHLGLNLDSQRHWRPDEPGSAEAIYLPANCAYAQNDAYLELCNPGWEVQWRAVFGGFWVTLPALFVIWCWYGFAVHPLLFDRFILFWVNSPYLHDGDGIFIWFGWLLVFPLALGCMILLYGWYFGMGMRTGFGTHARGRVRFNRLTRKVYLLRPDFCGGNKIFEWSSLAALMSRVPDNHPASSKIIGSLVLYRPPTDPQDWSSEDALFVGPSLYLGSVQAEPLWEYIRRYMEEGPTIDEIPQNPPDDFKQVARFPPVRFFTYCGLPSWAQYKSEMNPGFMETTCHMLSQATCNWPRFPKEWQSDSGLGEPEDRPVQTGAVMTALVYRAEGRLSPEDEVELMARYGTPEGLAEAHARLARSHSTGA